MQADCESPAVPAAAKRRRGRCAGFGAGNGKESRRPGGICGRGIQGDRQLTRGKSSNLVAQIHRSAMQPATQSNRRHRRPDCIASLTTGRRCGPSWCRYPLGNDPLDPDSPGHKRGHRSLPATHRWIEPPCLTLGVREFKTRRIPVGKGLGAVPRDPGRRSRNATGPLGGPGVRPLVVRHVGAQLRRLVAAGSSVPPIGV